VPADVVSRLGLAVGQLLKGEVVARLDRAADEEGAFRAGLRSLERRAHAAHELAGKLERKGHPSDAVAGAISRLEHLGLLDDSAFARLYVSARSARGRGPVRIRHDLQQLGIAPDLIATALRDIPANDADPLEQPRALARRRAPQLRNLPVDARRRRLLAFLARRGFTGSDVRALVEATVRDGV
jgi:regulatory protein